MANTFTLDGADAALLALGQESIATIFGQPVNVDAIGPNAVDNEGTLILQSPMVRIRFLEASYAPGRDNQRLTYSADLKFLALCYCENLRSPTDEKIDTLKLLNAVQECFAGARITLGTGRRSEPISLGNVLPMMTDGEVIDGFYSMQLTVPGFAQFGGANTNFGAAN